MAVIDDDDLQASIGFQVSTDSVIEGGSKRVLVMWFFSLWCLLPMQWTDGKVNVPKAESGKHEVNSSPIYECM